MLPTCLVGSYPQPEWLIDRAKLSKQVPRVRARDLWLVGPEHLRAAQDDATILAIRDQERAGIDIVSDGEQQRESYSNHFATALEGVDSDNPGRAMSRMGRPIPVPRITAKIRRRGPVAVRDVALLRAGTDRKIKATVPGPFTMSRQCQDDHYGDEAAVAMDFADAVNGEIKDLFAAGADVVQVDEPWMQQYPDHARAFGLAALDRAISGVGGTVAVHLCFGYAAVVHDKPTGYSFLAELENCAAPADLDRSRPAQARPRSVEEAAVQDHHPGRDRPVRHDRRDARDRGRPHPRGFCPCAAGAAGHRAGLRHEVSAPRCRIR